MAVTSVRWRTGRRMPTWWVALVSDYYAARHAWELQAEAVTAGYATEMAEYRVQNPPPRFADWLAQAATWTGRHPNIWT